MENNGIKKIIIFYPSYENGGATKILQNIINFFTNKKIKIILISCNAKYSNFNYHKNFLKIVKPKIILSSFFFQRIIFSLSVIKIFVKEIISIDNKDTIIFSMQSHLLSVIVSKILFRKIVIRNSEDVFGATRYADDKISALIVFLTKFITFNLADGIITNSNQSLKSINFFLLNKKKVKLIFNPYLRKSNKKRLNRAKKNYILAIGRFTKQKNFPFLLNAFSEFSKKYEDYKLILIGSGKDKKKLLNLTSALGLETKIIFFNWKNNLNKQFGKSKFFILPSLYEGSPNILIEALNQGIPCISSNCSGSTDILLNGKIGIIYEKNDKAHLIKSMIKMHKKYSFFSKKSLRYMNTSKRFLIKPQSKKYLNFLSKFIA